MFSKKKKKPQISQPTNFEHRVHTGFDKREGRYVGLPLQWASIVGNNQILKSTNRPLPLVDPSEITPTEILDLKTIVRGDHKNENRLSIHQAKPNGIVLPKTSNVARSNSLRSSSPPRLRRGEIKSTANIPPVVPEEHLMQYPSMRRDQNPMKPPQQQMREQHSPASSNNEIIHHHQHNGNMTQHDQYNHNQYNQNNHRQISPAGSMASVPPMVMNHMNVHPHINAGPHHQAMPQQQQQQQHNAFIHRPDHRPDQNQNIKNGTQSNHNHNQNHIHQQQQQHQLPQPQHQLPQPQHQVPQPQQQPPQLQQQQQQHPNPNNAAATASKQQHEQRLTHEQVAQYQKKQYYVTIPRY